MERFKHFSGFSRAFAHEPAKEYVSWIVDGNF